MVSNKLHICIIVLNIYPLPFCCVQALLRLCLYSHISKTSTTNQSVVTKCPRLCITEQHCPCIAFSSSHYPCLCTHLPRCQHLADISWNNLYLSPLTFAFLCNIPHYQWSYGQHFQTFPLVSNCFHLLWFNYWSTGGGQIRKHQQNVTS